MPIKLVHISKTEEINNIVDMANMYMPASNANYDNAIKNPAEYGAIYGVVLPQKELIGFVQYGQIWLPDHSSVYLANIAVIPQCRRKGYATQILKKIKEEVSVRTPRPHSIIADVRQSNIVSQGLFHASSYHRILVYDLSYNDEPAHRFEKYL